MLDANSSFAFTVPRVFTVLSLSKTAFVSVDRVGQGISKAT